MNMESTSIAEVFRRMALREVEAVIQGKLDAGEEPYALLLECQRAMEEIGRKFETGDYYVAELILSAKMFETASGLLAPRLHADESEARTLGTIILGTPKGDIHDLGKNIFRIMAQAAGFRVTDLGIDVPPERFIVAVEKERPRIVGMSGLLTTTFPSMKAVVDLLTARGLRSGLKIIIGGGATGEEARRFVGADAYTLDAARGVAICRGFLRGEGGER
jgi:dimethylamine corrinoid protein